jgi:Mn-containing catalase
MPADDIQQLLVDDLRDLYDVEKQLTKALPKMAVAASSEQLAAGFVAHLETTKKQAERLETMFELLGEKPRAIPCKGIKGIIEENQEHLEENQGSEFLDAILTGGGRKVEHYEIAGYSSAAELARMAGQSKVERLLRQTLAEEERMDRKLAQLSARLVRDTLRQVA